MSLEAANFIGTITRPRTQLEELWGQTPVIAGSIPVESITILLFTFNNYVYYLLTPSESFNSITNSACDDPHNATRDYAYV